MPVSFIEYFINIYGVFSYQIILTIFLQITVNGYSILT